MRAEIEAGLGPVDLLVANAGGNFTAPGALEETPLEGWRATIKANLTATFLTLKVFLPGMKERRRGDIVTSRRRPVADRMHDRPCPTPRPSPGSNC